MTGSRMLFVVFYFTFGIIMFCGHARHHQHHKNHMHLHNAYQISVPLSLPSAASTPSPDGNSYNCTSIFDVRAFGAVGDGVTDDTEAFQTAWNSACQSYCGVIHVPQGYTFMILPTIFAGPCQGGLVFQIDGTITPPDGPDSWPKNEDKRQWLVFYAVNELLLTGIGMIDGRGQHWWSLPCKPRKLANGTTVQEQCDSPMALRFFMSNNLTVDGIKIKDSPQFNFRFDNCKNVHIESIQITAPALSPNTDGIHIENTNNVTIYNSSVSTGDDCVSIGAGSYDVHIKNITCGPSHGISIGSLGRHHSRACVSNITVKDSIIINSHNGLRIKTWQGGSGAVTNVTYDNIHMDNVINPIIIDQFYCLTNGCANSTSAVAISFIEYTGIKGTYNTSRHPMHVACSDSVPCRNLTFVDIELTPAEAGVVLNPFCWNAYGELKAPTIPPVSCILEGIPSSHSEDIGYC